MTQEYSPEFKFWYERHFLQSPSLCKLEYDDEKMWEAWKASKQWQGLSDEEIIGIRMTTQGDIKAFARAIEQKLKEKNNG